MNAQSERPKAMGQAEFARHRGVSKAIVTKWKGQGLLVLTDDGKVDVEQTEWALDQRPANYRGGTTHRPIRGADSNNAAHAQARPKPVASEPQPERPPRPADLPPDTGEGGDGGEGYDPDDPLLDLKEAIERKENYLGLQRRLDYLTKKGRLTYRSYVEMRSARSDLLRQVREAEATGSGAPRQRRTRRVVLIGTSGL